MARTWLMNSRGIATKVKNAGRPVACQLKDCGASRQCPNCHYGIDNSDASHDWPGLPAGVKFDPSDIELLDHLAAKCGVGGLEPHKFIEEFIPTLDGDEGINYTHPENLPGAKMDGSSIHFFYRIANAYATGQRKRRRIQNESHVRWHKTGKTKRLMEDGIHKGCKKIMVLYHDLKKGSHSSKRNWVMHQYHLGTDEDEREGEYVVSKIFYQPQKETNSKNETTSLVISESDMGTIQIVPNTPNTLAHEPARNGIITPLSDYSRGPELEDYTDYGGLLAGESQAAVDLSEVDLGLDFLQCDEIIDSIAMFGEVKQVNVSLSQIGSSISAGNQKDGNAFCGIDDINNIELDTPPDFNLNDLQFGSQDSVFDWVDRI